MSNHKSGSASAFCQGQMRFFVHVVETSGRVGKLQRLAVSTTPYRSIAHYTTTAPSSGQPQSPIRSPNSQDWKRQMKYL
jgi:hypothetical protein